MNKTSNEIIKEEERVLEIRKTLAKEELSDWIYKGYVSNDEYINLLEDMIKTLKSNR